MSRRSRRPRRPSNVVPRVAASLVAAGLLGVMGVASHTRAADAAAAAGGTSQPTTNPADDHRPHGDAHDRGGPADGGPDGGGGGNRPFQYQRRAGPMVGAWMNMPDPTPQQWSDIQQFMSAHAPYVLSVYRRLEADHADPDLLAQQRRILFGRYQNIQNQAGDAALYKFALDQFELEDHILDGLAKLQKPDLAPDAKASANEQVDKDVSAWLDKRLEEREKRLAALRDLVDKEQAKLASDKEKRSESLARQRRFFEEAAHWLTNPTTLPSEGFGRGPGGFGGPGRGGNRGPGPASRPAN